MVFTGKELDFVTIFPAHQTFGDEGNVVLSTMRVAGENEIVFIKDIGIFINPQRGMDEEDIKTSLFLFTQIFCASEEIMGFKSRDAEAIPLNIDDRRRFLDERDIKTLKSLPHVYRRVLLPVSKYRVSGCNPL